MRVDVTVEVGGVRLRNAEIAHLEVHQELGAHHLCALEFTRDEATDLPLERLLDQPLRVTLSGEDGEHEPFAGQVVAGSQAHLLNAGSRFRLEAASKSVALGLHRDMDAFENLALPDLARRLAGEAGLPVLVGEIPAGARHAYLQQSGETDWEFLVRIADEHGCWVRPTAAGLELRAGFEDRAWELLWGANLLALSTRCRLANPGFKGAVYQADQKREHRFHAVRSAPALLGGATALVNAATRAAHAFAGGGDPGVLEDASRTPTLAAFKGRLEAESQRSLGTAVGVEGGSTHPGLRAGDTVHVSDAGTFKLAATGKFGLTRVVHRWDGAHYANDFAATPWAAYTSEARPPRPSAPGFVTAEVVDNRDPQAMGRVRVRFRWQDEPARTLWVRVLTPHAGNGRGMLFLPEAGDEVVVGFEQGDPERPCVLGSVWNGRDRAPQEAGVHRLVTASGNAIHLSDAKGKETVEIHTSAGKCLLQLSNGANGVPTITLHAEGDLALEATGEIRMSCKRLVQKVDGDAVREVGGSESARIGKSVKVKAGGSLALAAGTSASFQAGGSFEAVAGARNSVSGATVQIQPPGHVKQVVTVPPPATLPPIQSARPVPAPAPGTRSADPPTPRAGTRTSAPTPPPAAQTREPLRVTRVEAGRESVRVGEEVVFRAAAFNRRPEGAEASTIRWALQAGDGPLTTLQATGAEVRLTVGREHDDKLLRMHAFVQSPSPRVSAVTQVGTVRRLIWMQRIPAAEREAFRARVLEVSARVGADPDHLMACMAFETGATFSPGVRNGAGSGATGLIQFMPSTARALGTTTAALAAMTRVQQMDYVERYFADRARGGRRLSTIEDVYMAILYPAAIGRPNDYVLFRRKPGEQNPRDAYVQNRGLDRVPRDGLITKGEAAAAVRRRYEEGQALRG
jgi:uncharacterized protein involved in type VI secretion and phage assembly